MALSDILSLRNLYWTHFHVHPVLVLLLFIESLQSKTQAVFELERKPPTHTSPTLCIGHWLLHHAPAEPDPGGNLSDHRIPHVVPTQPLEMAMVRYVSGKYEVAEH